MAFRTLHAATHAAFMSVLIVRVWQTILQHDDRTGGHGGHHEGDLQRGGDHAGQLISQQAVRRLGDSHAAGGVVQQGAAISRSCILNRWFLTVIIMAGPTHNTDNAIMLIIQNPYATVQPE